jgi:multicomponent Na+:H+ antiporter subunit B
MMASPYLDLILIALILCFGVMLVVSVDYMKSIITIALISVLAATAYLVLSAPDVALTEAAVGACASSCIILFGIRYLKPEKNPSSITYKQIIFGGIFLLIALCTICYLSIPLHNYGDSGAILNDGVAAYYIANIEKDIGIKSLVTAILASYRGADTFCETLVIFTAGPCVIFIFGQSSESSKRIDPPLRSIVLIYVTRFLLPFIFAFGIYVQINSSASPGGGFQAGAIMASGFILHSIIFGTSSTLRIIPVGFLLSLACLGMGIYLTTGIISSLIGETFLDYSVLASELTSAQKAGIFSIELGVGFAVFATICIIYYSFINSGLIKK